MPESHKAERRRQQKQNKELGIGDENGRIVRVKDPPKMASCTICSVELRITKTNTELTAHATSKHGQGLDECFPGAAAIAAELVAASGKTKSQQQGSGGGMTKAERKKKQAAGMDDLLNAGLSASSKKTKGKK